MKSGAKQKKWHTPGALRLEVQLKTVDKISEFFGFESPEPLRKLPGRRDIYEAFRQFMLGFQRRQYRTDKCTLTNVLANCESLGVKLPTGESMMEWHLASARPDAHRKMQDRVSSIMASTSNVDWEKLLPYHSIPATVDVFSDGATKVIPAVPLMRARKAARVGQRHAEKLRAPRPRQAFFHHGPHDPHPHLFHTRFH